MDAVRTTIGTAAGDQVGDGQGLQARQRCRLAETIARNLQQRATLHVDDALATPSRHI